MQFQTQSDFLSLFYFILWTKLGINITKIEEFEQKFIKSSIIILFHQLIFRNFLGYLQLFTNTCQKHVQTPFIDRTTATQGEKSNVKKQDETPFLEKTSGTNVGATELKKNKW